MSGGTSIWTRGFGANVTDVDGSWFAAEFDPESDYTFVGGRSGNRRFSLPGGIFWNDPDVEPRMSDDSPAVIGLSPQSAFITTHRIVTFMPTKGKMIVGPFDASSACREGEMSFAAQAANATEWKLPLVWNASGFGVETIDFDIGFRQDVFAVPRTAAEPFSDHLDSQLGDYYAPRAEMYSLAQAVADLPTIRLSLGAFALRLPPDTYLVPGLIRESLDTTFYDSRINDPALPRSLLKRLIVQFDALNNRVGVCVPK